VAGDHDSADDHDPDDDIDLADLSDDELEEWEQRQAEKKENKSFEAIRDGADRALNRWHDAQPVEVRTSVIENFVETGEIDHEAANVDELEAQVVQAAFLQNIERTVLRHYRLSLDAWYEHLDHGDLPAFRRAAVDGNWQVFHDHAKQCAALRHELGI